ncbi:hypothetical protein EI42_00675 [Thermosporothrix hazakensis]|jgi:hypothetical protein|uniref:DUF5348 domain-containing protein n=2 Tax=Thermosporothrix TaxID=768650 RepID=A0A326UR85_THEHA|nr:DUF5348 domain-containing protein [Thermosporothrix hazakensis]PZW36499.1 hypothetical protein EI42_00675 [Thermosporothrix hazakensis]BBH88966.1 hypothetical protein KTC_37170 [Thermosporothrix sp. COM3]GCE47152.1 hypothetical protein KTH_20210 [Thermosporothrix hazakensis]
MVETSHTPSPTHRPGPARLTDLKDSLLLNGQALSIGQNLEVCILGHWLPGQVAHDTTGWYLLTPDRIGIRLRAGVLVRLPEQEARHTPEQQRSRFH